MRCPACKAESARVKYVDGQWWCHECGNYSEAGGVKVDGILTRHSFRVRDQQRRYEGDFVQPEVYNKSRRKLETNPDFIRLYPHRAKDTYKNEDLKDYPKLKKYIKTQQRTEGALEQRTKVKTSGSSKQAIKRILDK